jgi:hypothetical protein
VWHVGIVAAPRGGRTPDRRLMVDNGEAAGYVGDNPDGEAVGRGGGCRVRGRLH